MGKLKGDLPGMDEGDDIMETLEEEEENQVLRESDKNNVGWFSSFRSLVGNKQLTSEDLEPVLERMKENLINKNVAAEPAQKICESVGQKLEGKVVGTFSRVASIVKESVRDALIHVSFLNKSFENFYNL